MRRSKSILKTLALAGYLAGALPVWAVDAPGRVVSMNLCTDQLAMMLAAPGQLVSVSRIALDPVSSAMSAEAAAYPINAGIAEEVFALAPDLVLGGTYTDPFAVQMLRDLGIEVVQFPIVSQLSDIPDVVRQMGAALGRVATADILAREVEARLDTISNVTDEGVPEAAFFFANGYSLGAGTLSHDIVTKAGFANLAERLGRSGGGRLSLEELLLNRPDVLVSAQPYPAASRSEEIMAHPALDGIPRVASGPEWVCGTPLTLRALDQMVALRETLE
ncbi:ABC transporter substrate-binding protein [uncultured Boseongicola sp.]|uniref:ABC transporter substrate-binding protein n=1 Tax=uncultured Boseongicola sp. TaxID=1648499 RepID=UPI00261A8019|nr:ABC transporter substrate-binding protein [uncultured Boseongicola sp.]